MSGIDDVFSALDREAVNLLGRIENIGNVSAENESPRPTIGEQVKIFEAVVAYATLRSKANPPAARSKESEFDRIKDRFHGNGGTTGRGRTARKGTATTPDGIEGIA